MKILHIDSSILGDHSVSRRLSAAIVARLRALAPDATIVYRDLAATPLPQFTAAIAEGRGILAADRAPETHGHVTILDDVVDEVVAADVIVIGAPMYNFGLPTQLKAWLDALAFPGRTFRYGATGAEGLLGGRRVIVASARGGIYAAGAPYEHQESHLRAFFGFLGVTDLEVIRAEGVKMPDAREAAISEALHRAGELQLA